MEQQRKVVLCALGVREDWNPLKWFKDYKQVVPQLRIMGFASPMRCPAGVVREWAKTDDAYVGLYGWRGVAFEMFDWTLGETYLKLRDGQSRGMYGPFIFPPDGAVSSESVAMIRRGDTAKGFEPMTIVGLNRDIDFYVAGTPILKLTAKPEERGLLGLFISDRTDLNHFTAVLNESRERLKWVDPVSHIVNSTGPQAKPAIEVVES